MESPADDDPGVCATCGCPVTPTTAARHRAAHEIRRAIAAAIAAYGCEHAPQAPGGRLSGMAVVEALLNETAAMIGNLAGDEESRRLLLGEAATFFVRALSGETDQPLYEEDDMQPPDETRH